MQRRNSNHKTIDVYRIMSLLSGELINYLKTIQFITVRQSLVSPKNMIYNNNIKNSNGPQQPRLRNNSPSVFQSNTSVVRINCLAYNIKLVRPHLGLPHKARTP